MPHPFINRQSLKHMQQKFTVLVHKKVTQRKIERGTDDARKAWRNVASIACLCECVRVCVREFMRHTSAQR